MTSVIIANETPQAHNGLSGYLTDAAVRLAPHVTDVNGLTLPDTVRFRLTTPAGLARAFSQSHRQQFRPLIAEGDQQRAMLKTLNIIAPAVTGIFARIAWPCMGGAVVIAADGVPEIVMVPASFRHIAMTPNTLDAVVAHELDHVATFHARPGFHASHTQATWEKVKRQETNLFSEGSPFGYYMEGRAVWTQRQVTERVHGDDMSRLHDGTRPGVSTRARLIGAFFTTIKLVRPEHYKDGATFIAAVHESGGLGAVNAILEDQEMLPTQHEVHNPDQWLKRFADAQ